MTHVPYQQPAGPRPLLAFIGEAPSHEEVAGGAPLIGPSGRIFNAMLRSAGLRREDFLVTNVFDEQLPDNELGNWVAPMAEAKEGGFNDLPPVAGGYLRPEHRHHLERLRGELAQWQPTVIVPLGGTALWALTGDTRIAAHRGGVIPAKLLVPGAKLLPTYHPMAVQHQWKLYVVVVGDLIKAHSEALKGPAIQWPRRELLLEPTLEDLEAWTDELISAELLSVDIETGWGQITSIGFAPSPERALVVPYLDLRHADRCYWRDAASEAAAWRWVGRVLNSPVPKLFQNGGGYDLYWLLKHRLPARNAREDTRLLHHALYPELPKGLEFMGNSYASQGPWKMMGRKGEKKDE